MISTKTLYHKKLYVDSIGKRRWREVTSGIWLTYCGIGVAKIKPSETSLNKGRLVNFSKEKLAYSVTLDVRVLTENHLNWFKYEVDKWSVSLSSDCPYESKSIISFENPQDGMRFILYKEQIENGTLLPNKRKKRKPS